MFDFDFDIDFDEEYEPITIDGLLHRAESKERILCDIPKGTKKLKALISEPPTKIEVLKMLSVKGGFSSINIIDFVAEFEKIQKLYCSTLRVGVKQFEVLKKLYENGRLNDVCIVTSTMQKQTDSDYNYFGEIEKGCKELGFELYTVNNHSKVILMKTAKNYYVCETSSNLNENPKIEQFSFENDKKLFEWYLRFFEAVKNVKQEAI